MKLFNQILLASALTLASFASAGSANAHAHLLSAVPAENAMAMPSPTELKLNFSEELNLKFSSVEVIGPDMKKVDVASEALDPKDAKILIVTLKAPLAAGKFTVNWKAFSEDGHKTNGSYTIDTK
ncbi:MAG: copper homeostasis periplasmic binding protein CopC [Aestuariivirga sp.]